MISKRKLAVTALTVFVTVFSAACKKKPPSVATPLLPKAEMPALPKSSPPSIMEFITEPNTIERGQYALLRWLVTGATEVTIQPDVGLVATTGRQRISPANTTEYVLHAKGPGGEATASALIRITEPPPSPVLQPPPEATPMPLSIP